MCHFIDTLPVLKWLGYPVIKNSVKVPHSLATKNVRAKFSQKVRQSVAGTGKVYFVSAAAEKLTLLPLVCVFPDLPSDIETVGRKSSPGSCPDS